MVSRLLVVLVFGISYISSEVRSQPVNDDDHNSTIVVGGGKKIKLDQYLELDELLRLMKDLEREYPTIVRKNFLPGRKIGNKTTIWALQISHGVNRERELLKPMFKYVANIHGDEMVGYALLASLMQYLVYMDGVDERVTNLLNTTDIWIVPTMNPVGLTRSTARNGNGVDLDLDFPDIHGMGWSYQHETMSLVKLITDHPFVLSGNLQGGSLEVVASYPRSSLFYAVDRSTDEPEFKQLALDYARLNPQMSAKNWGHGWPNGIVDEKYWKNKTGDMQEANYVLSNCFEIVLYVSVAKRPNARELPKYWKTNLQSLLNFMESTRKGIFGLVKEKNSGYPVKNAVISVKGKSKDIEATKRGEYWRLLVPGRYTVTASAPGCYLHRRTVNVTEDEPYVRLDFTLVRQGLYGHVEDEHGNPIRGALVQVNGKAVQLFTNKYGEYAKLLSKGQHTVTVSAQGYAKSKKTVELHQDASAVRCDFVLKIPTWKKAFCRL